MNSEGKEVPLAGKFPDEAACMAEGVVTADGRHKTDRLFDVSQGDRITVYEVNPRRCSQKTTSSHRIPRRRDE